jgi:type I restriction enzyme S subunit
MSDLPQGWKEVRLGEVAQINMGQSPSGDNTNLEGLGFPLVGGAADYNGDKLKITRYTTTPTKIGEAGDLIVCVRATIGKIAITDRQICLGRGVAGLRATNIDKQYLKLYLSSQEEELDKAGTGSTFRQIDKKTLNEWPIPLPPLEEQRRIVAKLDVLLGRNKVGRQELSAATQLIKRQRQAVLTNIFQELNVNKSSNLAALSTLITSGSRGWAKYYATEGAIFIRVGNTQRDNISLDLTDIQYVQPPIGAEGERTKLRDNDLVISITADIGRVSLIENLSQSAYVNQHVCLIRLENPQLAKFIAWYLVSSLGQEQLLKHNRGMTKAGLGLSDIRNVLIPLPSLEEQREIVRRIEAAFARIDEGEQAIKQAFTLAERLEQATLAKAFRGEL